MIIKFSEALDSTVSQRWRDLLYAEQLTIAKLQQAGVSAAKTAVVGHKGQRF